MQPVRVIAGLGNPGSAYDGTRHNIGFILLDALASDLGVTWRQQLRFDAHTAEAVLYGRPVLLMKPQTFMNLSGISLQKVCRELRLRPCDFLVVHDEFQLPLGRIKVSRRGSAGGHNGIEDIIQRMGAEFNRFRIGIGADDRSGIPLTDFVLGKFAEDELKIMNAALPDWVEGIKQILREGVERAMNQLNQRKLSE